MEKIDIILWILGVALPSIFTLMGFIWHALDKKIDKLDSSLNDKIDQVESSLNSKIDRVESSLNSKIDKVESLLTSKIDKLDEKLTDIDRRLCRLEGAFTAKDCCVMKQDHNLRKVE